MIFIGILIGLIIGLPIGFIKWKKKPIVEKYSRRGLLYKKYSVKEDDAGRTSTIECVFEVGELESTDTLSKIEIIDFKPNRAEYNTDFERKRLSSMVDKSWQTSKDIHWITTAADKRNHRRYTINIVGSHDLITSIKDKISSIGVNVGFRKTKSIYELNVRGNRQIIKVLEWIYKDTETHLDRKYEKYQDMLNYYKNK